jgi:integrase
MTAAKTSNVENEAVDGRAKNYLTPAEIKSLLAAARVGRDRLLLLMMFRHGLRVSEAVNMRRDAVDLDEARLQVNRLKGSTSTQQPIEGDELRMLRAYLKDHNSIWLFPGPSGSPLARSTVNILIAAAGERAGLGHVHPHMLRHSCGYYLANEGLDSRLIQDYLGHRDANMTARYTATAAHRFKGLWR